MREKILIESEQYNLKRLFGIFTLIGIIFGAIFFYMLFLEEYDWYENYEHVHDKYCYNYQWIDDYYDDLYYGGLKEYKMDCYQATYGSSAFSYAMASIDSFDVFIFIFPVIALTLLWGLIWLLFGCYELTVTDKRITGKVRWSMRVDLPIDSVSAVGMGNLKSIIISTPSGRISFLGIKNRDEIYDIVSDLLVERQNKSTEVYL